MTTESESHATRRSTSNGTSRRSSKVNNRTKKEHRSQSTRSKWSPNPTPHDAIPSSDTSWTRPRVVAVCSLLAVTAAMLWCAPAQWGSRSDAIHSTPSAGEQSAGVPSDKRSTRSTIVTQQVVERELALAHADAQRREFGRVTRRLERLLARRPPSATVNSIHFELADAYNAMNNMVQVTSHLTQADEHAVRHGSREDRADAAWALVKLHLGRKSASRPEIIALLRRVLADEPQHDNAKHWLGHQLMQSPFGVREAATILDTVRLGRLTDSDPLDTVMLLGQAHDRLGNLEKTVTAFGKAVTLYKRRKSKGDAISDKVRYRFGLSHFQLCKALLLLGRADEAFHVASAAARDFPDIYHIMDAMGLALAAQGRWNDVVSHYATVHQFISTWPPSYRDMPLRVLGATLAKLLEDKRRQTHGKDKDRTTVGGGVSGERTRDPGNSNGVNGGWPTHVLSNLTTRRCNIDVRPGLTPLEFLTEYAHRNLPVIIPKALDDWPAQSVWRRTDFAAKYGRHKVRVRQSVDIAYDNEFGGLEADTVDLNEYLDRYVGPVDARYGVHGNLTAAAGTTRYVLESLDWGQGFRQDYIAPPFFESSQFAYNHSSRDRSALAFFGPAGSSVTLHEHTNAWNALVYGMKRWVMLPPYVHYGPTGLPVEDWLRDWYPRFKDQAYECMQFPGDLVYVPTNYMHTLINVQASIGVAVEFGHDTTLLHRLLENEATTTKT
eukprot:m.15070 g.15070  ORF g.15070 m.15070 type:complete len:721 (+) comp3225_c0_seq1:206-2368(+)